MMLQHPLRRALLVAAIYLLTAQVLNALRLRHVVGDEAVVRLMGMLMGAVVVVSANVIPKQLVPLARLSCAPAREQALRRLCGWAGVLGGLGYTLAYALAPIAVAAKLAMCFLAPAALVIAGVAVRCTWVRRRATS